MIHCLHGLSVQRVLPARIDAAARLVFSGAILLAIGGTESPGRSAEPAPAPYKAQGAPAAPQVPVPWNQYHDYGQATKILQQLAATYPRSARLQSLGASHGGREMWLLTVTDLAAGKESEKPAFWIDGGIHANEIQGTEVVLYTAWYLLESQHENPQVAQLLKDRVFYLLPMMSPDSRDAHFHEPNTTSSPRAGQRPVDDDRDGLVDEDPADDLNGDGHITQMRIKDRNGRWKPHPDFPLLLVPTKPGERGEYELVGNEGLDNDGDGRVNEDGDGAYDPNRDWPWKWEPPYVQHGAYRYPLSLRENRVVADFILAHPNIAGAQSYHNAGGMILRSPGARTDRLDAADVRVYDQLAKIGEQMLPGYDYKDIAFGLYEVWGGEIDWFHQMLGIFTFSNELFTRQNYFRADRVGEYVSGEEMQYWVNKYLLLGEGVVAWQKVEHPQYGTVDVGGMKKNWGRQPPSFLLEEECHRNMAFTLYHADQMPQVRVQQVQAQRREGGLWEVTACVENTRLIPTHAASDLRWKITPPDIVTLRGSGIEVLAALTSGDRFFRDASQQQREPARVRLANIPGHSVRYVRWLVTGEGPYRVEIQSVKGGRHAASGSLADVARRDR